MLKNLTSFYNEYSFWLKAIQQLQSKFDYQIPEQF